MSHKVLAETNSAEEGAARFEPVLEELNSLLKGEGLPRENIEHVDGMFDQPMISRGQHHEEYHREPNEAKQPATLRKNCVYIVAVVVTEPETNSVLMVQEAKSDCHGLWYLPAGRVENKETLDDAARRECLEESGMQFEPKTLAAIEMSHRGWFRFIYSGELIGGHLKSPNEADGESLQAAWLPVDALLKRADKQHRLRSSDILWLLEVVPDVARAVIKEKRAPALLPIPKGRDRMYLCCVLAFKEDVRSDKHLPVVLISPRDGALYSPLDRLLKDVWKKDSPVISYDPVGLLALEHNPNNGDGILMAILCQITTPDRRLPPVRSKDYAWLPLSGLNQSASTLEVARLLDDKLKRVDFPPVVVNV